ncbi:MAG: ATP-binding protein, partial [Mucilaginibacter sp.]
LQLSKIYINFNADSALIFTNKAYELALSNKSEKLQIRCFVLLGNTYVGIGDYSKGIQMYINGMDICKRRGDVYRMIEINNNLGSAYNYREEYKKALQYSYSATRQLKQYSDGKKSIPKNFKAVNVYLLENIGTSYLYMHQTDSAIFYFNKGINYAKGFNFTELDNAFYNDLGRVEVLKGNKNTALNYFKKAEAINLINRDISNLDYNYLSMAEMYEHFKQPDSAIYYAQKSLRGAREGKFMQDVLFASRLLYKLYDEQHNIPGAYQYYKIATQVNDSIYSQKKTRELVSIDFEEKQRQQEIESQQQAYQSTLRTYLLVAVILFFLILAIVFRVNNLKQKKTNFLLSEQKEEIETQRDSLGQALEELKNTQSQLIQSEKMASLGELTAGIAHEIQNPLNFVNNFSEVNIELMDEMEMELTQGDKDEAISIASDIRQNLEKIRHHGKRADSIVKGMLQHSRASSTNKEPTDLNKLADEYLRLAYHGLRAKDKNFNAEILTHFYEKLPLANLVPQDIGRVLLNLFTNAFYAVQHKQKDAGPDFKPTIEVTTGLITGFVQVKVKDNGSGIAEDIKDKIMQPFFTTKPTGEGTGLGLSMSYDIVVKGHNGNIDIDTKEGDYTEFITSIPT